MAKQVKEPVSIDALPDGGWGWMVVLGAAVINMVNQALFSVFGLIFGETLKEMAGGHATGITLVMAVSVCVTNFSGLLVGPMIKRRISVRTITIFGVASVSAGMILSSFATAIWHIVISYGFLTGMGLGLVASSTFLAISEYFTTRKSTAVGLSMAGTSTGQMVMPTIVGLLIEKYDFHRTTLILGCVSCCGMIGAFLFRPIFCCKKPSDNNVAETGKYDLNSNSNVSRERKSENIQPDSAESQVLLAEDDKNGVTLQEKKDKEPPFIIVSKESMLQKRPSCLRKVVQTWDLHLLQDFKFVHMSLGLGLGYVSSITFSTFFPMFLQDEVHFTMWQTTTCMTALSAADIVGRMTISEIFRKLGMGNRSQFMVGALLLAVARSLLVYSTTYTMVMIMSVVVGYLRAITVINQNLVISEYIPKEELPSAVGLNMLVKGFFVISVGEPLGMLKDAWDYDVCIHLLDVILICIAISWSIEIILYKKCHWINQQEKKSLDNYTAAASVEN
ncbi:monocarboxylate transporter 12-like [Anthonomus grandis grandis]|uniref:monocarboxylate transporter 12-like n=1 Tax=Anthonomus grandis grandis TaxID=2921223 RepID=UPI002165AA4B|nr:monocarboxylate transporter 12-like [Anthonomus grandis grandis]XP_050304143.1 monocarboxylate transporter 12-like [Anthonomus grandis grandis]XP_050304144.1 monocarboxylate transporter 12-like [Anthonomus grandis grandis]